jgi:hypothetical protein
LAVGVAVCIALTSCRRPPQGLVEEAEQTLRQVGDAGGVVRAPEACLAAQAALLHAQAEISLQGKRSALSRDYGEAGALAGEALHQAQRCAVHAKARTGVLHDRAARLLADLEDWIGRARALARQAPARTGIASNLLKAEIVLGEARASFEKDQYERSEDAATRGRIQVFRAIADIAADLDSFRASPRRARWRRWVQETLKDSERKDEVVVIVDKLRRQLTVMRGREELASYAVDLGAGGIEVKTRAGDDATPEGRYRITEVRAPGQTRFYRALMLDYPNSEDTARFRKLQRAGRLHPGQGIGGLIEIHGTGGRGQDWTEGCVALEDGDMDELVPRVGVGTAVTIVGMVPEGAIP